VAGHSLGGVVAVKLALTRQFQALVLQASFPDRADGPALPALGVPSLSLAAAQDCQAKLADVTAGWATLPGPTALVVVPGATHYQFTESQREDEARGCAPDASLATTQARVLDVTHRFLVQALADGGVDGAALGPASEVTVR